MPILFFLALLANYCSYKAITLHSSAACAMLEISYPVWCYLFCYLLFDKIHWNMYTTVGVAMITLGTLIFLIGEK
jgi:drug/metabolite transporter (DMT)-like permease